MATKREIIDSPHDADGVDLFPTRGYPQNIYDHPRFFEGYRALRQNDTGLNGALEVPALHALLPDMGGKHVLDLGCGFGDFARHARGQGARSVLALDVSQKMITEAIRLTDDNAIAFMCGAIEEFSAEPKSFDLVVSSMALHYVKDFGATTRAIFDLLRHGGLFVFSVEHPTCTANPVGWVRDEKGQALYWPLDRYQDQGGRNTSWFIDGVVKFHRTTETYVNTLIASGFCLHHLGEPRPQPEFLEARPWLTETLKRPPILVLAASRR